MSDGRVPQPGQAGVGLELGHDELGDELRERVRWAAHLLFVDDGVGGQAGQGVVAVTPLEEDLGEGEGV